METNRAVDSWVMIVLGFIVVVSTCFFTYIRQYFDWQINGECHTNPLSYLVEFPLSIILVVGIVLVCAGIARRLRRKE